MTAQYKIFTQSMITNPRIGLEKRETETELLARMTSEGYVPMDMTYNKSGDLVLLGRYASGNPAGTSGSRK